MFSSKFTCVSIFILYFSLVSVAQIPERCIFEGFRLPKENPHLGWCCWHKDRSCCSDSIEPNFVNKHVLEQRLDFLGSKECYAIMNDLSCLNCSPHQSQLISTTGFKFNVCKPFCQNLYDHCREAKVDAFHGNDAEEVCQNFFSSIKATLSSENTPKSIYDKEWIDLILEGDVNLGTLVDLVKDQFSLEVVDGTTGCFGGTEVDKIVNSECFQAQMNIGDVVPTTPAAKPSRSPIGQASPSPMGQAFPSPSGQAFPSPSGQAFPSPIGQASPSPVGQASPSPVEPIEQPSIDNAPPSPSTSPDLNMIPSVSSVPLPGSPSINSSSGECSSDGSDDSSECSSSNENSSEDSEDSSGNHSYVVPIVIVCVILGLILFGVVGYVIYKRRQRNSYTTFQPSPDSFYY